MPSAAPEAIAITGEHRGSQEADPVAGAARPAWFPPLPPGYTEQNAWSFRDAHGVQYDFYRVYGPPHVGGGRGDICDIDHDRCFWATIWSSVGPRHDEHIEGRWMSFAQAVDRVRGSLRFARFSSPLDMAHVLPDLLQPDDLVTTKH